MMYKNKLAVAIKSAGKVLREFGETVYVPFGNEYSIFVKNVNSVRALVSVSIDGDDVGDGSQFVIGANDSVDIERFIKNGNLDKGNRLKFIERSDSVEQHRGVGVEDGLIRVEFQFERVIPEVHWNTTVYRSNDPWNDIIGGSYGSTSDNSYKKSLTRGIDRGIECSAVSANSLSLADATSLYSAEIVQNDAGITVPGSISDQTFQTVSSFPTEMEKHEIVLKMLGQTADNVQVVQPVTVKAKPVCTSCNRTNKATAKFCTECGTSLTII